MALRNNWFWVFIVENKNAGVGFDKEQVTPWKKNEGESEMRVAVGTAGREE